MGHMRIGDITQVPWIKVKIQADRKNKSDSWEPAQTQVWADTKHGLRDLVPLDLAIYSFLPVFSTCNAFALIPLAKCFCLWLSKKNLFHTNCKIMVRYLKSKLFFKISFSTSSRQHSFSYFSSLVIFSHLQTVLFCKHSKFIFMYSIIPFSYLP